jgi:hypothetical protein
MLFRFIYTRSISLRSPYLLIESLNDYGVFIPLDLQLVIISGKTCTQMEKWGRFQFKPCQFLYLQFFASYYTSAVGIQHRLGASAIISMYHHRVPFSII